MAVQDSKRRVALITGVTGQDGAYLAEFLLGHGYTVHGIKRRSSSFNTARVDHLYEDPHAGNVPFLLHYGDMTDSTNLIRMMQQIQPTEIYNLAAQSHVGVSFETPEYTANADAHRHAAAAGSDPHSRHGKEDAVLSGLDLGALRPGAGSAAEGDDAVLSALALWRRQALRLLDHGELPRGLRHVRLERHPVQSREPDPRRNLRHAQDHARVARIETGLEDTLYLGNLDAKRDWGHARDYVEGMRRYCRRMQPDDFVLATGETRSVREFVELAFAEVGRSIEWRGKGVDETGVDRKSGKTRGSHRSGLFPADRSRSADRRRQQGARQARLEAEDDVRAAGQAKWWRAILRLRGGRSPMARTPFELKGKTVFVAGHRGMVGGALVRRLARKMSNC